LEWKSIPDKTQSFALILDDPDAPNGVWDHWILFNIPRSVTQVRENVTTLPDGAHYGKNSWGNLAYNGPCPPSGEHRYVFKLYALNTILNISSGIDKSTLETAMEDHVLGVATLVGVFKK
jgi:Raf kinase inhibitor-like YbhB/YbcL family protein